MAKKQGGLSSTMQGGGTPSKSGVVKGKLMDRNKPPFDKPHDVGPSTIPLVFFQDDLKGERPANVVRSTMGGQQTASTGKSQSGKS